VVAGHVGAVRGDGGPVEPVRVARGRQLGGTTPERDHPLVVAGVDSHHAGLAQHLEAQRRVLAERDRLLQRVRAGVEPAASPLDHPGEIEPPHPLPIVRGRR